METFKKVSVDKRIRRNATVKISLVGTVTLVGFILSLYSIFTANFLFALWYFVAFVLGLSYVVIRLNAVFPTYVMIDGDNLVMSVWENGIMPYRIPEKPNFLSDFMPEKIKKDEISLDEIKEIYIGSKRFFDRQIIDGQYPEILKRLVQDKHFEKAIKRMDFLLVVAKDGEECFMSVTDFEINGLADFIDLIEKNCVGVQVFVGIPKLKKIRETIKKA